MAVTIDQPRIYRLAAELRRCAIYLTVGMTLAAAVMLICYRPLAPVGFRRYTSDVFTSAFGLVAIVCLILHQRWALRVDERGVARRRFWRWDLWEWTDFASGRIQKRGFTFFDPARPIGRRTLSLHSIANGGVKEVLDLVNERYRLPPPPAMCDLLNVRYGLRRSATLDSTSLRVSEHGQSHASLWNDVHRLRIVRIDPLRRDFTSLELFLPDRVIQLVATEGGSQRKWWGAGPEEVNAFLLAHVPMDRVDIDVAGERPSRLVDIERQLQQLEQQQRDLRRCLTIAGAAVGVCLLPMALDNALKALLLGGVFLGVFGTGAWIGKRNIRLRRDEMESWLAEFDE